jgi:hypothetical protein
MINFAPFINLLLRKKPQSSVERTLTETDKAEIEKINNMGMFEAMDYLANKKEEKITYCGACGGDASHCDGC